ncbi:MAG: MFS transporter [Acidimicrobiales bacterium]
MPPETPQRRGIDRLAHAALPEPGPVRTLTKSTFTNSIGNGLYYTVEVIFFTRSVGLPVHLVALGLGVAALCGLVVSIPAGHLCDRRDPRLIAAAATVGEGVAMGLGALVHSFTPFLLLCILAGIMTGASSPARSVVLGRFGQGDERVRVRAYQRAVTNFGMSIGIALSGVGLALDTRAAYLAMVLGNAVTFMFAAGYILRLPHASPSVLPAGGRREPATVVLRDRRYLTAAMLNGLFEMHFIVQSVALPLWVISHTTAPHWWVSVMLLINTTMVITLQVRLSRGAGSVTHAARTYRLAGLFVGVACILYALTSGVDVIVACVVLVVAIAAHTIGELYGSAASWGVGYGMAREDLMGQYQGAFSLGRRTSRVIGPSLVTILAISEGRTGWLVLAAIFITTGAAFMPLASSYARTSPAAASGATDDPDRDS